MRKRNLFPILSLLAVFLAACAPAETQTKPPEAVAPVIASTATSDMDLTATGISTDAVHSATPVPTVQALATSRGPNLEATDPKTVSMAAGGLQFVEFFEFW